MIKILISPLLVLIELVILLLIMISTYYYNYQYIVYFLITIRILYYINLYKRIINESFYSVIIDKLNIYELLIEISNVSYLLFIRNPVVNNFLTRRLLVRSIEYLRPIILRKLFDLITERNINQTTQ